MTLRPYQLILSVKDLIVTAERLGSHFFDLDTMRFFNSRVSETIRVAESPVRRDAGYRAGVIPGEEPTRIKVLFITSERDARHAWNGKRRYTVRTAEVVPGTNSNLGKDIIHFSVVGEFGGHRSLSLAKKTLRSIPLNEWSDPAIYLERKL